MSLFNYDQKINPIYCFAISCTQRRAAERTNRGSFAVRFFSGENPLISAQSDGFNSVLFFSRFSLIWFICSSSLIFVLFCFFIYIDCGIDTRARNHLSRSLKQFFLFHEFIRKSRREMHMKNVWNFPLVVRDFWPVFKNVSSRCCAIQCNFKCDWTQFTT